MHHAEAARVGDHAGRRVEAVRRVVVLRVECRRADVGDVVATLGEPPEQVLLQLKASVVGSQVYPHAEQCVSPHSM